MEYTPEIVASLSKRCKTDKKLAAAIAKDLVSQVDPVQVARLICESEKVTQELLIRYVQANLARTLAILSGEKESKKASKSRHRMSDVEIKNLKKRVLTFIKNHPGSSRAAIQDSMSSSSRAVYNRIMKELLKEKAIKQKGQRRMAVYV